MSTRSSVALGAAALRSRSRRRLSKGARAATLAPVAAAGTSCIALHLLVMLPRAASVASMAIGTALALCNAAYAAGLLLSALDPAAALRQSVGA